MATTTAGTTVATLNRASAARGGYVRSIVGHLAAVDKLALAYLVPLAALTAVRVEHPGAPLVAMALLIGMIFATARWATHSGFWRVVHDFLPIAIVPGLFDLSAPAVASVNSFRGDALLSAFDAAVFGAVLRGWRGMLGRPAWFTDIVAIVYVSFYFLPVVIAVALYRRSSRTKFERYAFRIAATFLVSFLGYFLVPTAGPRVPPNLEAAVLGGGAVTRAVFALLHVVERNQLDAFPSGHTAISLAVLGLGWAWLPRYRPVLTATVLGIIFSTVYLSLHYVVDLVAGAVLAAAMPLLWPTLETTFGLTSSTALTRSGSGAGARG